MRYNPLKIKVLLLCCSAILGSLRAEPYTISQPSFNGGALWTLVADDVERRNEDQILMKNVVAKTYRNAQVEWTLTTPHCVFDNRAREAVTEKDVRIQSKNMDITGKGFHWLAKETRFILRKNVLVTVRGGMTKTEGLREMNLGSKPSSKKDSKPAEQITKINSNYLDFDYEKRVAQFDEDVSVVDPEMALQCKNMEVRFAEKTGEVSRVVAKGEVQMLNRSGLALCDKGVFTRETGIVVLSGDKPSLKDPKGNWIVSHGDGIIYNIHTQQVRVDKPSVALPSNKHSALDEPSHALLFASNSIGENSVPKETSAKLFTKIDADALNYDQEKRVAAFDGNVIATDSDSTLKCKKLLIYFSEKNNEVMRIEATGDVWMSSNGDEATGDSAIYTKETNIILITGKKPKLKKKDGSSLVSNGKGIMWNAETKKMFADKPSVELPITSEGSFLKPSTPPAPQ